MSVKTGKLRIGIDVSRAVELNPGIRTYIGGLLQGLSELSPANRYVLYPFFFECFPPGFKGYRPRLPSNFTLRWHWLPSFLIRKLWYEPRIPLRYKLGGIDVLHSTAFTAPQIPGVPLVVTVHDLSFLTHPECHFRGNIDFCTRQISLLKETASAIITDSECTKSDLIAETGIEETRITPVYLGVDHGRFRPVPETETKRICEKHGITAEYLLFIGSVEPRKNLSTLFKSLKNLDFGRNYGGTLVIAGGPGWKNEAIYALPEQLGIADEVKFLGYVPGEDIPALYSAAKIFVYPSLYEGFGLPVLEAMACGTPVITSNTGALPEVVGKAGVLVDPHDAEALGETIRELWQDDGKRGLIGRLGLEYARQFTWKRTAEKTLDVYGRFG